MATGHMSGSPEFIPTSLERLAHWARAHSLAQLRADGWQPAGVLHRLGLD